MEQALEIAGVVVGVIYLWLEYRASIYLWIASIVMPAIYLFVYYDAGLYADTAINIYYLVIALYGWAAWKWGFSFRRKGQNQLPQEPLKEQPPQEQEHHEHQEHQELKITHISVRGWIMMAALYVVAQLAITMALLHLTDSDVAWFNGLTSALSIVGMYMLARKYIEQWWVWLVVDLLSAALYYYKDLHFTAALYAAYAVIAVFGYYKWKRLMLEEHAAK